MKIEEFVPNKIPVKPNTRCRGYLRKPDPVKFPDFNGDFYGMIFLEDNTPYQLIGVLEERDGQTQVKLTGRIAPPQE